MFFLQEAAAFIANAPEARHLRLRMPKKYPGGARGIIALFLITVNTGEAIDDFNEWADITIWEEYFVGYNR